MLILIVGPSGAGKDTLLNGVREALGEHASIRFVRRVITRPGDMGEEDHESVTEQEFDLREQAGDFALSWRAHGLKYGIPADISIDLAKGRVVVANVSRAVVAEAAEQFPVSVIEITAPPDILAARLERRGREDRDDVARRLSRAIELPLPIQRQTVVNDGTQQQGVARLLAAIREAAGLNAVQG
ncbi:MAG TPA: phosphonate metabolism protein/1,5-bisphosphokinase (PRPP-forming) PhnN [Acetobacteraceae bacterium]|nr:phosphonate metabolism protein/1,5-bisphosphokinase (PRPP-forming) PhnN [Acetobacteraceae bacterium]